LFVERVRILIREAEFGEIIRARCLRQSAT
jgi:hypothetical protein